MRENDKRAFFVLFGFFDRLDRRRGEVVSTTPSPTPLCPSDALRISPSPPIRSRACFTRAGTKTAALLVALVAFSATVDAQTLSAGAGRGSYTSGTTVTTQLALSTGVDTVKTALDIAAPNWGTVKTAYDNNLKATADEDRTGDPVWNAFKAEYGSPTFITDYFYKVVVRLHEAARGGGKKEKKSPYVSIFFVGEKALNPQTSIFVLDRYTV